MRATAWLVLCSTLPERLVSYIRPCRRDPKKAWDKIEKEFAAQGQAALDVLEDKLQRLRMRRGHFADYANSLFYLLDRIADCRVSLKIPVFSDERLRHFLLKGIDTRDPLWTSAVAHARTLSFDGAFSYLEDWDLELGI